MESQVSVPAFLEYRCPACGEEVFFGHDDYTTPHICGNCKEMMQLKTRLTEAQRQALLQVGGIRRKSRNEGEDGRD